MLLNTIFLIEKLDFETLSAIQILPLASASSLRLWSNHSHIISWLVPGDGHRKQQYKPLGAFRSPLPFGGFACLADRSLCGGTLQLLMSWRVCSELITYWHLSLLQPKVSQSVPMLKAMWALNIHRLCQWYWQHCLVSLSPVFLTPEQFRIPHYLSLVVLDPVSHWNLMFLSTGGDQGCEERQPEPGKAVRAGTALSQSSCVHCMAAAVSHCRAHTLRDSQVPQGWDCTVTRARLLFVTSPCKCFHVGTAQLLTTTALLNPRLYEHQHIIPASIPSSQSLSEAQCPFSTDEPLLTVNFTPCVSLLTQYTQLPCFLPKQWGVL